MNYRKPLATKDMRYTRLSRRVKNMPILLKSWNSPGVNSRYLSQISLKLYGSCLLCHFGMFFMQLWGLYRLCTFAPLIHAHNSSLDTDFYLIVSISTLSPSILSRYLLLKVATENPRESAVDPIIRSWELI